MKKKLIKLKNRLGELDMENRDISHQEQIERWANFVRDNPEWKKQFKKFSDAQIIIARRVYDKLNQTQEGRAKIKILKRLEWKT